MENGPEAFSLYIPQEAQSIRGSEQRTLDKSAENQDSLFFDPGDEDSGSSDIVISDIRQNNSAQRGNKRKVGQRPQDSSSEDENPLAHKRSRKPSPLSDSTASAIHVVSSRTRGLNQRASSSAEPEPATRSGRALRSSGTKPQKMLSYNVRQPDEETDVESRASSDVVYSDLLPRAPQRPQRSSNRVKASRAQRISSDEENDRHTRRSGRTERKRNTYTDYVDDDDEDFTVPTRENLVKPKPRYVSAKERFPIYDDDNEFVQSHNQTCDTCRRTGDHPEVGHLVYCQGCSYSYHKVCLGSRSAREHLVTRITEDTCVMQCRRCIGRPRMKDKTAPCLDRCQKCRGTGVSCVPFKPIKKGKGAASEKASPEVEISPDLINNPENVLFRCAFCRRGYHFEHLPARGRESEKDNKRRLKEYSKDWKCLDCVTIPNKIEAFIAWRPADKSAFDPELYIDDFNDDEREYLVKFEQLSYFRAKWMPGPWVWGLMNGAMRNKFCAAKPLPKLTFEDAVDPEFLNVEIVLDVKFTSIVPLGDDASVDLARVKEVSTAMVKYRGLTYEEGKGLFRICQFVKLTRLNSCLGRAAFKRLRGALEML